MDGKCLIAIPELCTGCNRCAYMCSALKTNKFSPYNALIKTHNFSLNGFSVPNVCYHCESPDCLKACPEEAIIKDETTGIVTVDEELCTGCGECVAKCPYGMIELNSEKIAKKCNLCDGDPACVKECNFGAIIFEEPDREMKKEINAHRRIRIEGKSAENKRHQRSQTILENNRKL
ncbi:MAG: 4Fe-4S dicluster domain-containing protein [Desulfobacterales bacterium]|nr:4Fe-4S dicluster domain-containing protein [Desulfobacterales bacterium]